MPALDGIRGLAILLVLFFHIFSSNPETGSKLLDLLNQFRESCYLGVNLFFVLSGFLITGILLDTRTRPHFFKTFYARRALRIFPSTTASCLCYFSSPDLYTSSGQAGRSTF
ncbi:acyltransferase family protein [Tunturiibacter gelidiferens]|uniref:acyltransferase family protein n=1 Tax=Tunturiibacter gelidiferens TaxID=3069689 RepID=UPI003D9B3F31